MNFSLDIYEIHLMKSKPEVGMEGHYMYLT